MQETTCPSCGECFVAHYGVDGAPADGMRGERYCSEWCRDRSEGSNLRRAQEAQNRRSASRAPWKAPESFPWDSSDPSAE